MKHLFKVNRTRLELFREYGQWSIFVFLVCQLIIGIVVVDEVDYWSVILILAVMLWIAWVLVEQSFICEEIVVDSATHSLLLRSKSSVQKYRLKEIVYVREHGASGIKIYDGEDSIYVSGEVVNRKCLIELVKGVKIKGAE